MAKTFNTFTSGFNGTLNNTDSSTFDWTKTIATCLLQSQHEFEVCIINTDGLDDDKQLQQIAAEYERRCNRALDRAKQNRSDPEASFLSAMRNWGRNQAIQLLRKKVAGKKFRSDYHNVFLMDLREEIEEQIDQIQLFWKAEDEKQQQAADEAARLAGQKAKEAEAERRAERDVIWQADHESALNAYRVAERGYGLVEDAYKSRDEVVNTGYKHAEAGYKRADAAYTQLETRMQRHESYLENVGAVWLGMAQDARSQQKRESNVSLADNIIQVGGKTLGCLFWLVIVSLVGFLAIFLALQLAFHH